MPDFAKRPTEWIVAVTGAILALLLAFGINLTDRQAAAIVALVGLLAPAVTYVVAGRRGEHE